MLYTANCCALAYVQDLKGDFLGLSDVKLYWVSFVDGNQRVLLFTDDSHIVTAIQRVCEQLQQFISIWLNKKVTHKFQQWSNCAIEKRQYLQQITNGNYLYSLIITQNEVAVPTYGHATPTFLWHGRKVGYLRELEFDDNSIVIIHLKPSKFLLPIQTSGLAVAERLCCSSGRLELGEDIIRTL